MIEQCPGVVPRLDVDEGCGQDDLGHDGPPVVLSELLATGVDEFSIEWESFLGSARFPEPVRQVVRGDVRLPAPPSVPLQVAGQSLTPGGEKVIGGSVSFCAVPECSERPSPDPP